MPKPLSMAVGLLMLVGILGLLVWFIVRQVKRSEDPTRLLVKLAASIIILGVCLAALLKNSESFGVGSAFLVPFICVALGVIGSILWAPHIGAALAKPITAMFDGGNQEVTPQPLYSIAIAKRKAGKYQEAIYEILHQLEQFPTDATGQMMLAEIQAEDLKDLAAAELTVQRLLQQTGHAPESLALALNELADWHLKYAHDREAARLALEKITELLPDSDQAQLAQQRLAHLPTSEILSDLQDRATIQLQAGVENVGLMKDSSVLRKSEEDPVQKAAEYIQHLQEHPQDAEAREKLAAIYAEHYQRTDLAIFQLEELIQHPNQPAKDVVRWVNQVADLQIKNGESYETVRQTLERIIDLYPARSYAQNARQRIEHLKLQMKARETVQGLKLGTYEQKLGLKKKSG